MDGILLVDKPSGPTSFDVVRAVRRAFHIKRVGHAGTLDPLASGLLIVCIGQGTKLVPYLMDSEKHYTAKISLGTQTDTDDSQGEIIYEAPVPHLDIRDIEQAISIFLGEVEQVPPIFSAIKKDGEALYKKARRGEDVKPLPRKVLIHSIDIINFDGTEIELEISCGKGTYIRSLARDLGAELGTRAHLCALRRTYTSGFSIEEALSLAQIDSEIEGNSASKHLLWGKVALPGYPTLELVETEKLLVKDGRPIKPEPHRLEQLTFGEPLVLLDADTRLVAIGDLDKNGIIKMRRVFNQAG